jgi:integrase
LLSTSSNAGVDIEQIADAAGHANSHVTRTVYRHQIADKVSSAAKTMDDIFGRVSGS